METTTLELPTTLYTELQALAETEQAEPVEMLARLIERARQPGTRSFQETWLLLCNLVARNGGLDVPEDPDELIEHLRVTRDELFEREYAHLYR